MNIFNITRLMIITCTLYSHNLLANNESNFTVKDYSKLCNIYKYITAKPINLSSKEKEMKLTQNVQDKLPVLFNKLFIHIIKADVDIRYKLIKQYAQQQNKVSWDCETARLYYTTQF